MRRTIIDIGTNTILMLIADFDVNSFLIKSELDIQRVPRLGKEVDAVRNILPESTQKAIDILNEYKKISNEHNSEHITATATSFIRDANNRKEFLLEIKQNTGIDIEILSGEDEAKWTFWGGVYDKIPASDSRSAITTIDIGGGSTEITTGTINQLPINNKSIKDSHLICKSLNVGSVRINEKFLKAHPPSYESIVLAEEFINNSLEQINYDITNSRLIGVAGTVTTLGAIKLGLDKFIPAKVDNTVINITEIEQILTRLSSMTLDELYFMGDYMTGRADIILPGILILKCFMRKFGFNRITVSTKGLRYGIFLRESTYELNP